MFYFDSPVGYVGASVVTTFSVPGIRIAGVVGAVPPTLVKAQDIAEGFAGLDARRAVQAVGLGELRRVEAGQTSTDLAVAAAERLLELLGWSRDSVDALVMVSQTPDHLLPGSSYLAHARLRLPRTAMAFDVSLGCSGFVYGMALVSRLLGGQVKRAILLAADTLSLIVDSKDKGTAFLFGDAGTATALEWTGEEADRWTFELGADGTGATSLIVPSGGFRCPTGSHADHGLDVGGVVVPATDKLVMDGMAIYAFSTREVPPLVMRTVSAHGWGIGDLDGLLMHQANRMILTAVARKLGVDEGKVPSNISRFGNTAVATIPLLLADREAASGLDGSMQRVCLVGFGVGLSWGAAAGTISSIERDIVICPAA